MRLLWTSPAATDRQRILDYLTERNPRAADNLLRALRLRARTLTSFPYRGRAGTVPGTREYVALHPYVMVYQVDAEAGVVSIIRLWHGAQNRPR